MNILKIIFVLFSSFVSVAFSAPDITKQSENYDDPVNVTSYRKITLFNRKYEIEILGANVGGQKYKILQISGGGIIVSFNSTTGPFEPVIKENIIMFGGHQFEVLDEVHHYRVDGKAYNLAPPGIYVFSDGRYAMKMDL